MKKLLLVALALMISGTMLGQQSKKETRSYLALHIGPSFPIGNFSSADLINNENAGLAKTGYSINLSYGYDVKEYIGLATSVFYNYNPVDEATMGVIDEGTGHEVTLDMDHWQFYGFSAGPKFTMVLNNTVNTDLRVMGGLVNVNSPKISFQGQEMLKGDWNTTGVLQVGIGVNIGLRNNMFIFTAADYMYMDPNFKYTYTNDMGDLVTEEGHQNMAVINLTAGFGLKF